MKTSRYLLTITLVLLCLLVQAACAASSTAGISSAPADTSGTPPQNVSLYISEAKAATAETNWTGALLITTQGLAWYPESADLLCLQGYTYRKMGQYQKSVDVVSRAIPLDKKTVRYANRGYGFLALGNYSAALADAETGLALDAGYTTNYGVKALALSGMGKNTEALAAIETAIAQSPENAHYWHVKGRVLAAQGDCSGAAAAFEKSVGIDPGNVLPYPGFGSAGENLAALNATCMPARAATPAAKSPFGLIAVAGFAGAVIIHYRRR
jgi:tetratricopeptide (TPR) repeat protein